MFHLVRREKKTGAIDAHFAPPVQMVHSRAVDLAAYPSLSTRTLQLIEYVRNILLAVQYAYETDDARALPVEHQIVAVRHQPKAVPAMSILQPNRG